MYVPVLKRRESREVILVLDTTFFGKRVDKFGLLIAKDIETRETVSSHFIESGTNEEYIFLRQVIENRGYCIKGVIIDGLRGLYGAFKDIPIQEVSLSSASSHNTLFDNEPKAGSLYLSKNNCLVSRESQSDQI